MTEKNGLDCSFLGESPLFIGLETEEIEYLLELAAIHRLSAGESVVEEGSMGDAIFLLHSGKIAITTRDREGKDITLATLSEKGAFFGEISLVDPGPRSATVRVETEAILLELTLECLEIFFGRFPEARVVILRNIARVLARRLRQSNVRVAATASSS